MALPVHPDPEENLAADLELPTYESICPATVRTVALRQITIETSLTSTQPIIVTFWRYSYVHVDFLTKKSYTGRRAEKKTDVTTLSSSTSWEDFTFAQVSRSIHLFGWNGNTIKHFAFNISLKVNDRTIPADPDNWHAVRDLVLSEKDEVELVISVCPSALVKPRVLRVAACSVFKAMRKLSAWF